MMSKNFDGFQAPPLLLQRFSQDQKVSLEEANERFVETQKFLTLCATNRKASLVPSQSVDAMWHQFILFTRDYSTFCEALGGYVHHQPSAEPQAQDYERTVALLSEQFGMVDSRYWPKEHLQKADCDCCP